MKNDNWTVVLFWMMAFSVVIHGFRIYQLQKEVDQLQEKVKVLEVSR